MGIRTFSSKLIRMCHQTSSACISVVEDTAVKESLLIYCKPVELYNILQRRALSNPLFLPRCLQYKIQAKREPRLTDGYVIFNYRDHNNLIRQTEVTSEFSCPFCLLRCSSFKIGLGSQIFHDLIPVMPSWIKGLRYHLNSSHGIFKFDFWANEEYRAVNVSVKLDVLQSEIPVNDNGCDPGKKAFSFCSKPQKRRRLESPLEKAKHVHPQPCSFIYCGENVIKSNPELNEGEEVHGPCPIDVDFPNSRFIGESHSQHEISTKYVEHGAANANAPSVPAARVQSFDNMEYAQPPPLLLPNAKTRKFSLERADSKSGTLLQKRQFFHSHRAQPMALEQVLSDRDSEDEVDDELSDLEDRRMLDDFVDVTKDEKHLMHLWNSFVRKQRVLADGHVPWACEAFLRLHALELVQAPAVFWCWRLFMIKLWNHGLVDASTMNNCNKILEKHRKQASQMIASS